jgi:hypothetical protein
MVACLRAYGPPVYLMCTWARSWEGCPGGLSRGSSREGMTTASQICPTACHAELPGGGQRDYLV